MICTGAPDDDVVVNDDNVTEDIVTETTKILASFCVDATSVEVRNCIRLYSERNSYKQQCSAFSTMSKQIIIETLLYLGANHKHWNDHLKTFCVSELIYRIQCLLPEDCSICKNSYTIKNGDPSLLSCRVCHQEVHAQCYLPLLKASDNKLLAKVILGIPGLHFLCPSCEEDFIPGDDGGLKKGKQKVENSPKTQSQVEDIEECPITPDVTSTQVNGNTTISSTSHPKPSSKGSLLPMVSVTSHDNNPLQLMMEKRMRQCHVMITSPHQLMNEKRMREILTLI